MYEMALHIFNKDRKLASKMLKGNVVVLHTLSQKSLAISKEGGNLKRFIEGAYSPVWRKLFSAISMARRQFNPWYSLKDMYWRNKLVNYLRSCGQSVKEV